MSQMSYSPMGKHDYHSFQSAVNELYIFPKVDCLFEITGFFLIEVSQMKQKFNLFE